MREFFEGLESDHEATEDEMTDWESCHIAKTTLLAEALFCSETQSEVSILHNGKDEGDIFGHGESSAA